MIVPYRETFSFTPVNRHADASGHCPSKCRDSSKDGQHSGFGHLWGLGPRRNPERCGFCLVFAKVAKSAIDGQGSKMARRLAIYVDWLDGRQTGRTALLSVDPSGPCARRADGGSAEPRPTGSGVARVM